MKEKSFNPAAAHRKTEKKRDITRNKRAVQAQRNEKLAKRNPERVQNQIHELAALEQQGALRPKDRETLTQLQRDLRGIQRAREALGQTKGQDQGPQEHRGQNRRADPRQQQHERRYARQTLGKRTRDDDDNVMRAAGTSVEPKVDPAVLKIPMPSDTPPPFPRSNDARNAQGMHQAHPLPPKPAQTPSKTVYSSAPQLRDLKKEATKFLPAAVLAQRNRVAGNGRLIEPEEAERLEDAGYLPSQRYVTADTYGPDSGDAYDENIEERDMDDELGRLNEEIANMSQEKVMERDNSGNRWKARIEDVEDEGD